MTVNYTYPGVYVEEVTGGVRTIAGVSTATTVFTGWATRGPVDRAQSVLTFADFERSYDGLDGRSLLGYAVRHFFENGGREGYIVRLVADNVATASVTLDGTLRVEAQSPGAWANVYAVEIRARPDDPTRFQFALWKEPPGEPATVVERFDGLSMSAGDASAVDVEINDKSAYVRVVRIGDAVDPPTDTPTNAPLHLVGGFDGDILVPNTAAFARQFPLDGAGGIFGPLDALDSFNLLVVPGETTPAVIATLQTYCRRRRAFFIIDSAENATMETMRAPLDPTIAGPDAMHSALYFPWVIAKDPLQSGQMRSFPPSGFVAGIYAHTDDLRGIWKAPAGADAELRGAISAAVPLTEAQNGELNPRGINCVRRFPFGIAVWGSRTLHGGDGLNSEWKYLSVRRLALFLEVSINRGTQWTVFEPNGEPLWARVRLNVGTFMNGLFRQGAFQGHTPAEAYFVKCDAETTLPSDIETGGINIIVGFAALKPAEFVITKIWQIAGREAA